MEIENNESNDNDGNVYKVTMLMMITMMGLPKLIPYVFEDNGNDQFGFLSSVCWTSGSSTTSGSHLLCTTPIIAGTCLFSEGE